MAVQNNAELRIIQVGNIGFGTIRLENDASSTGYRYGLDLKPNQFPSIYYSTLPTTGHTSVRLRPLHKYGFCSGNAETRLYFAVAGLSMNDPREALTYNLQNVTGRIYESKYYVFSKLGVDQQDINYSMADLQTSSTKMSTDELKNANAAKNVTGNTRVVYITSGELSGTFWAYLRTGWESNYFGGSSVNSLYRPMCLMDFSIQANDVNTAKGYDGNFRASLNLVPQTKYTQGFHTGHNLIDPNHLKAYYEGQNDPGGNHGINGTTFWANLHRLGLYRQFYNIASNATAIDQNEILPGAQLISEFMLYYYPEYAPRANSNTVKALQRSMICNMIGGFVNS
ncbi:hypothetical protein [Flexibacterium corallicola]|uniref:hypothetical protein n=1 Tax=Flexibacterium corallicola TaxID=3037259 RepID=UPI00286F15D9|nr:hypothetical protein [Pseudovibrio sp. M1P-2-3]